jgi:hypothetical protein
MVAASVSTDADFVYLSRTLSFASVATCVATCSIQFSKSRRDAQVTDLPSLFSPQACWGPLRREAEDTRSRPKVKLSMLLFSTLA